MITYLIIGYTSIAPPFYDLWLPGGEDNRPVDIILAGWVDRFVEWLID